MIFSENTEYFKLEVTVNGKLIKREIPTHLRLLDFLRDDLRLTGAKEVCAEGECGACTVLLDGITVNSCLILAVETHECEIMTIEGLGQEAWHEELKKAFVEKHSVQCGYCIPGMVLSAEQLIRDLPNPDRDQIKHGIAGNVCRCTGYVKIIDAIESAGGKKE